jgi:hypothetical protein
MSSLKPAIGVAALVASLTLSLTSFSAFASAETVVPPGNSAATQYTEGFPTAGGNAKANSGINGDASPAKVLGSGNAKKLESKGAVGHEVAELAAETAPAPVSAEHASAKPNHHRHHANNGGGNGGSNGSAGGGTGGNGGGGSGSGQGEGGAVNAGSGSSGFGEVLSQATGSSSGQLGLFLPLIIIGTVIWSLTYLWRQRRQVA